MDTAISITSGPGVILNGWLLVQCLQFENPALDPERNRMCTIVGVEFGEDVFDVTFDGLLRN